jgi:phosphatidate cytidylyltransferase
VKRVLTAVILIPIVVLALFKAPLWLFTLLVLGVALLAAREYLDITQSYGLRPFRPLDYLFMTCVFLAAYSSGELTRSSYTLPVSMAITAVGAAAMLLLMGSPFILMIAGMRRAELSQSLPNAAASFLLLPYLGLPLALIVLLRSYPNGALFLLYLMLLVWTGDVAAYYVGRAIGKHKLAPRVSPGKTWEGTIASTLGAVIVAVVLFRYLAPIYHALGHLHLVPANDYSWYQPPPNRQPGFVPAPGWWVIVLAIAVNVAAQLGDLVESMLKRGGGVKDSGALLPGHGGVLDRIDALLFAVPVGAFLYFVVLGQYFRWTMLAD